MNFLPQCSGTTLHQKPTQKIQLQKIKINLHSKHILLQNWCSPQEFVKTNSKQLTNNHQNTPQPMNSLRLLAAEVWYYPASECGSTCSFAVSWGVGREAVTCDQAWVLFIPRLAYLVPTCGTWASWPGTLILITDNTSPYVTHRKHEDFTMSAMIHTYSEHIIHLYKDWCKGGRTTTNTMSSTTWLLYKAYDGRGDSGVLGAHKQDKHP